MTDTTTKTRYQLRAPTGAIITSMVSDRTAYMRLAQPHNVLNDPNLAMPNTTGQTDTETWIEDMLTFGGETVFCDKDDTWHLAGDLHLIEIAEDGTEHRINREYTEGYEERFPLAPEHATSGLSKLRALKFATWYAEATHNFSYHFVSPEARERIKARARAYAEEEGVLEAFTGILKALNLEETA